MELVVVKEGNSDTLSKTSSGGRTRAGWQTRLSTPAWKRHVCFN